MKELVKIKAKLYCALGNKKLRAVTRRLMYLFIFFSYKSDVDWFVMMEWSSRT